MVVHVGDHWDMRSLNPHMKKKGLEGKRVRADIDSGNEGMRILSEEFDVRGYHPELHLLDGNHEMFIDEAIEAEPKFEGVFSRKDLLAPGWERHPFLEPVDVDGVVYAHYFYQPMTGNPYCGTVDNRLKQIGHSFTQGHQQTLLYGLRFVRGRSQHGLVAGACYLHDESYKGPQGNAHWRGVIVCHEVHKGSYDPMFVSLEYLCRRYEKCTLAEFKKRKGYK